MAGLLITFEGTEGSGKSTQIHQLGARLEKAGNQVMLLREPGGTELGEDIRHLLKHSETNRRMTAETELLLINACRAQLVREVIRPALEKNCIVLCDRFYDSTIAYQGYGRQLDLLKVRSVIDFATAGLKPNLTLLLAVSVQTSEERRRQRDEETDPMRDRFEEADRQFFDRIEVGFQRIASSEPNRVKTIDGSLSIEAVHEAVWTEVQALLN